MENGIKGQIWDSKMPPTQVEGVFWDTTSCMMVTDGGPGAFPMTRNEVAAMFIPKGYYTSQGYTGFLPDGSRMAFPTQEEYIDYVEELHSAA